MRKLTHDEIRQRRFTLEQLQNAPRVPVITILDNVRSLYTCIPHSSDPLALIIGNEITGVSKPLLDLSDLAIEVPMYGIKPAKGRLNVAVAYGVALFELVRIYHSLRASP